MEEHTVKKWTTSFCLQFLQEVCCFTSCLFDFEGPSMIICRVPLGSYLICAIQWHFSNLVNIEVEE